MAIGDVPENFEPMLNTYLIGTFKVVDAVLQVAAIREPERYADAADLVRTGQLIARIESTPGELTISLLHAGTGQSIGDIFRYTSPALAARGVAN